MSNDTLIGFIDKAAKDYEHYRKLYPENNFNLSGLDLEIWLLQLKDYIAQRPSEISGNADTLKHLEGVFQDLRNTLRNKTWMDGEQFAVLMDVQNRIYDRLESIRKSPKRESQQPDDMSALEALKSPVTHMTDSVRNMAIDECISALRATKRESASEISDNLRSNPTWYEDDIEQLAFELAFELEEADLKVNDYVTVNREKLKAVARRFYAKLNKIDIEGGS